MRKDNPSKLRRMRWSRGLKVKELAALAGSSPSLVSALELAGVKTTRIAKRYAPYLGCDPLELLD